MLSIGVIVKFVFLALLSLSLISCASYQSREPSSIDSDGSRGMNIDRYYGSDHN